MDSYDIGEGFGHFGVALPDVYKAAETIKAAGGEVSRPPFPLRLGKWQTSVVGLVGARGGGAQGGCGAFSPGLQQAAFIS